MTATPAPVSSQRPTLRERLRVFAWGVAATAALTALATLALSDLGRERLYAAAFGSNEPMTPLDPTTTGSVADERSEPMADIMRALSAERDALSRRIAALERGQQETAAAIARTLERVASTEKLTMERPVAPAAAAEPRTLPNPVPPGFVLLEPALGLSRQPFSEAHSLGVWSRAPRPQLPEVEVAAVPSPASPAQAEPEPPVATAPEPDPTSTAALPPAKKEYAVDLGGAANNAGLREILNAARGRSPGALDRLKPVVGARAGSRESRLVLGPLPTAGAAARLCATLVIAGGACQPVLFDPQRPALR